jgi:hypothetical protein
MIFLLPSSFSWKSFVTDCLLQQRLVQTFLSLPFASIVPPVTVCVVVGLYFFIPEFQVCAYKTSRSITSEVSGSHGDRYEDGHLLGCCTV